MRKRIVLFCLVLAFSLIFSLKSYGKGRHDPFPSDVHVILVGFDGWGSYCFPKADMPVLKRMMEQGSWTLKKRSVLPSSSAPNWAAMFMGASPEIHGYSEWNSQVPEIPSMVVTEHQIFPTISHLLCKQKKNVEIGLFCHWNGIKYIADTLSINRVSCLPVGKREDWSSAVTDSVRKYIMDKRPTLCTVVYDYPDHFGHSSGFDSEDYYESLKVLDESLGLIIQTVKDAGIYDKTIFVITSDHGGVDKTHGGKTLKEMETPFVIFGNNIKKGFKISDSMMQYDVAATIAYIFGLDMPQVWIGRPIYSVFERIRN